MIEKPLKTWHNHSLVQAVQAAIPPHARFDAEDRYEVDRILTACCMVLEPELSRPSEVKAMLTGLQNGYGSWLEFIGEAIRDADIDQRERAALYGAFCMATAFLFDISLH